MRSTRSRWRRHEDQQPVKTLAADGANEALRVRVCLWCADRRVDHFDPFAAEDLVEGRGELAVAVVDQEAHPLEDAGEAEIPRLLGDPAAGRVTNRSPASSSACSRPRVTC